MAMPTLESLTPALFETTDEMLGDTITYAIGGNNPAPIKAWVDHASEARMFGSIAVIAQEIVIEVRKVLVPSPSKADRITLPRLGNLIVYPIEWCDTEAGLGHYIKVAQVRA